MKQKKYLIVDDSPVDAQILCQYMESLPLLEMVGICTTVEETLTLLAIEDIDLLFLDVKLANQSGLNLLKISRSLPPVIVTSAYADHAAESYEIGKAADYILKPFTYERLLVALDRTLSIRVSPNSIIEEKYIFLKMGRQVSRFEIDAIDYIEAYGAYIKVFSDNQMFLVNERMSTISNLLPNPLFVRVHKSYIVNTSKIIGYGRTYFVILTNRIPIGESYRPNLTSLLRLFDRIDQDDHHI